MRLGRALVGAAAAIAAVPAAAGPPYLTDDPVPTETGHWEIYAFAAGEGRRSTLDADAGFDLNYGPVKDVQLTATLPLSFSHSPQEGWRSGTGDVEIGVKYRFFRNERSGVSAAIFPRAILPTSSLAADGKTRFLLPLWVGNRDFWQAAVALTHDISKEVAAGVELTHQGPDVAGGTSQTRAGIGTIIHLAGPASLLLSAGPTWADHQTGYHAYTAFSLNF